MAILRHHSIKPHAGIGGRTPAEEAGIDIWGSDKWMTPIPERRSRHITRPKHATPFHCAMFCPAPVQFGRDFAENRSKTPSRSPRIPSLGLAAARIRAI